MPPSVGTTQSEATHQPDLIIRSSAVHGAGCYTLSAIAAGTRILEYTGPHLSKSAADERYAERDITYLFSIGENGEVIDGFGAAMFINHHCSPNCQTEEDEERIFILALRDIAAGEELTYEYHLHDSDQDDQPCFCNAPNCRGTMFSTAEVRRRKKLGLPLTLRKPVRDTTTA